MGIVIEFPMSQRMAHAGRSGDTGEPAQVVILPVVRVERMPDAPAKGMEPAPRAGRKRRRRAQRS